MSKFVILTAVVNGGSSYHIAVADRYQNPAPFEGWEVTGGGQDGPSYSHVGLPVSLPAALAALEAAGCNMATLTHYVVEAEAEVK